MFSYVVAFAGCLCIASAALEWSEKPVSYSTSSVSFGGPSAIETAIPYASTYSYAPQAYSTYSALPASSEMFKYNSVVPQMSLSMPWMAKMEEPSKVSIMPMMAYGASYIPETYTTTGWTQQDLKQTHPATMPFKAYSAEIPKTVMHTEEAVSMPMPLKTYSPEFYSTGSNIKSWSTELKQTHPMQTLPVGLKAEPYTTFAISEPIQKEFVMPIQSPVIAHKESFEMPISIAKSSVTMKHKETPTFYTTPMEGFHTAKYMMPMQYETMMPGKEHFVMPMATSKSMFTMKHETPASTGLLTPSLEKLETSKFPFSYSY